MPFFKETDARNLQWNGLIHLLILYMELHQTLYQRELLMLRCTAVVPHVQRGYRGDLRNMKKYESETAKPL